MANRADIRLRPERGVDDQNVLTNPGEIGNEPILLLVEGSANATLRPRGRPPEPSGAAPEEPIGTGSATLASPTGTGSGYMRPDGVGAGTLASPTGSGSGQEQFIATAGAGTLTSPTGSGSGQEQFIATAGAGTLTSPTGSGSGQEQFIVTAGAGTLTSPTGSGAGEHSTSTDGVGAGTLTSPTGSGVGEHVGAGGPPPSAGGGGSGNFETRRGRPWQGPTVPESEWRRERLEDVVRELGERVAVGAATIESPTGLGLGRRGRPALVRTPRAVVASNGAAVLTLSGDAVGSVEIGFVAGAGTFPPIKADGLGTLSIIGSANASISISGHAYCYHDTARMLQQEIEVLLLLLE